MDLYGVFVWILLFGMVFSVQSFLEETEKKKFDLWSVFYVPRVGVLKLILVPNLVLIILQACI